MNVYRALSGAGLAAALAVGGWYARGHSESPRLSDLLFVGVALGLFFVCVLPLPRVSAQRRAALIGVAFLLLPLGSPAAWLLGGFAGVGAVVLWKAYQAKTGAADAAAGGRV